MKMWFTLRENTELYVWQVCMCVKSKAKCLLWHMPAADRWEELSSTQNNTGAFEVCLSFTWHFRYYRWKTGHYERMMGRGRERKAKSTSSIWRASALSSHETTHFWHTGPCISFTRYLFSFIFLEVVLRSDEFICPTEQSRSKMTVDSYIQFNT